MSKKGFLLLFAFFIFYSSFSQDSISITKYKCQITISKFVKHFDFNALLKVSNEKIEVTFFQNFVSAGFFIHNNNTIESLNNSIFSNINVPKNLSELSQYVDCELTFDYIYSLITLRDLKNNCDKIKIKNRSNQLLIKSRAEGFKIKMIICEIN